jgi:hypothetical protein
VTFLGPISQKQIDAVPKHVNMTGLFKSTLLHALQLIPHRITWVHIDSSCNNEIIKDIPTHFCSIDIFKGTPVNAIKNLPETITQARLNPCVTAEQAKALSEHIKTVFIKTNVSMDTITALPNTIQTAILYPDASYDFIRFIERRINNTKIEERDNSLSSITFNNFSFFSNNSGTCQTENSRSLEEKNNKENVKPI